MLGKKLVIVFSLLAFVLGILLTQILDKYFYQEKSLDFYQIRQKGFTYIGPLLRCDAGIPEKTQDSKILAESLKTYITKSQEDNVAKNISVYFRNLETGDWFGINESDKYTPASLLKIPSLIAYYKKAESDPNIFAKKIEFTGGNANDVENMKPSIEMEKGKSYTVEDLLTRMITESDNNAKDVLLLNIDQYEFDNVFEEIGMSPLDYSQTENFMKVKEYASFFRTLYNATYLGNQLSEKALALLTKTKFDMGLTAGIPNHIAVAHKFGERHNLTDSSKQLHDCGIVYYPNHPYVLCVMTRGSSFENLGSVIKNISQITYKHIDNTYTKKPNEISLGSF